MKLTILEDETLTETEVVIRCPRADERVMRMAAALSPDAGRLPATADGATFLLDPEDILYIESVDKKTFLYLPDKMYETPMRLYELEDRLSGHDFFRATRSSIINLARVRSLRPDLGSRLLVTLDNGERCTVSRQYVPAIREKLGIQKL